MGTNSKASHQPYVTAPTVTEPDGALATLATGVLAPLAPASEPPPEPPDDLIDDPVSPPSPPSDPEPQPAEPDSGSEELPTAESLEAGTEPAPAPAPPPELEPEGQSALTEPESTAGMEESGFSAGESSWQDALTPLPEELPVGQAFGVPVMVSGLELEDSALTLMSYQDEDSAREVLMATVSPEAEAALLDALSTSGTKMMTIETSQDVMERLDIDKDFKVAEHLATAAKSVNHKLKNGMEIPEHTQNYIQEAQKALDQAAMTATSGPESAAAQTAMVSHYQATLDAIQAHLDGNGQPYTEGGKIQQTTPYLHPTTQTITTEVPAPPGEAEPGTVPASVQKATRINATVDAHGKVQWNGADRQEQKEGAEYALDLGDGYTAVYRPHEAPPGGHDKPLYSTRGQLEIVAPPGSGHAEQMIGKLNSLNLSAAPASAAEGELAYLKANVSAQGLGTNPEVAAAMNAGSHLAEMHVQELFHAEGHRAVGLDAQGLNTLAREFHTRAARAAIPAHTAVLREAVAKATGHASGEALAQHPGYQPTPQATSGWLTWSRFDVTADPGKISSAFAARALTHSGESEHVLKMLRSGVLASTERRRTMGLHGVGQSEDSDIGTGGAKSVFLRVVGEEATAPGHGTIKLMWRDPVALMSNASAYGFNADNFGVTNPEHEKYSPPERDPVKIAKFTYSHNEVMFRHGIDLYGPAGSSRIITGDSDTRAQVLDVLHERGVTHLGQLPIEQAVRVKER